VPCATIGNVTAAELHTQIDALSAFADSMWEDLSKADAEVVKAKVKWETISLQYTTVTARLHDLIRELHLIEQDNE